MISLVPTQFATVFCQNPLYSPIIKTPMLSSSSLHYLFPLLYPPTQDHLVPSLVLLSLPSRGLLRLEAKAHDQPHGDPVHNRILPRNPILKSYRDICRRELLNRLPQPAVAVSPLY